MKNWKTNYILAIISVGFIIGYLSSRNDAERNQEPLPLAARDNKQSKPQEDRQFTPKTFSYQYKKAHPDGIGKVYMGREISHVMGHAAINWLERPERESEEGTDTVMKMMAEKIKPNAIVVDVGSGSGYYSFLLAKLVPEGKVIGVDIQPEMVAHLAQKAQRMKIKNVESNLGSIESIQLPPSSVDAVFMVDAYHEFSHPNEMMQSIVYALRPGGEIYLLEYRAEDRSVPIKRLHKMSEAQSILEMNAVGLKHVETANFLPWQHFMIFKKPKDM